MFDVRSLIAAVALTGAATAALPASAQQANMTFFITSAGTGKGADLGGLEGADKHCQALAAAAGAGSKTWRAYLSTQAASSAVNARDRIGKGPWQNAKGVVVAKDLGELHGTNNLSKQNTLTEKGEAISGRGDPVNMHDVLTGSQEDGTAFPAGEDRTCGNWSKSGDGAAMVGHHDRQGLNESAPMKSWVSSHPSRGCGQQALVGTGGAGLFYCFAAN